ncbi:Abc transporter c family member 5, partial [Globisporangium polare]
MALHQQTASAKGNYGSVPTTEDPSATTDTKRIDASFFSRLLFSYANPLMRLGNERQLHERDLWELEGENQSATAFAHYHAEYKRANGSLLRALWNGYWKAFVLYAIVTILTVAVTLFAPLVLNHVITAFAAPTINVEGLVVWLGFFFASRLFNAVMLTQMGFYLEVVAMRVAVALKALVFQKVMRRSIQSKSNDEKAVDVANLYTTDIMIILWAGFAINSVWILPLQIGVVIYMLYNEIGAAAFAGLGVIVLSMVSGLIIAMVSGKAYEDIMTRKDDRMKIIKEVFGAIQIVKLNAWEGKFASKIGKLRAFELSAVAKYMILRALEIFVMWASPIFVSTVSFAVYSLVMDQTLTAAKVFTSIALFNAIRDPLRELPGTIAFVVMAKISFDRVASFLGLEEYNPSNIIREDQSQPEDVVIAIENGSFGWTKDTPLLKNVNLTVKKG